MAGRPATVCVATDWPATGGVPCRRPATTDGYRLCALHSLGGCRARLPPRIAPDGYLFEENAFHRRYSVSVEGGSRRPVHLGRCTSVLPSGARCENCTILPQCPACLLRDGLLVDVQRISAHHTGLGLYAMKDLDEGCVIYPMHTLSAFCVPGRECVSVDAGAGLVRVAGGERIDRAEVEARYGDDSKTAPNAFASGLRPELFDCTWLTSPISLTNTSAERHQLNAEIIADDHTPEMMSVCIRATRKVREWSTVVTDYGEEYASPAVVTRHSPFPALDATVPSLYNFSAAADQHTTAIQKSAETVNPDSTPSEGWGSRLEQTEVHDRIKVCQFIDTATGNGSLQVWTWKHRCPHAEPWMVRLHRQLVGFGTVALHRGPVRLLNDHATKAWVAQLSEVYLDRRDLVMVAALSCSRAESAARIAAWGELLQQEDRWTAAHDAVVLRYLTACLGHPLPPNEPGGHPEISPVARRALSALREAGRALCAMLCAGGDAASMAMVSRGFSHTLAHHF